MEKMNFEQVPSEEPLYDERLEQLWNEYDFPGNPPKKDSQAEKKLRETCEFYAEYLLGTNERHDATYFKASDKRRRELHNQIALMVSGKMRSGMGTTDAVKVADFAFEYAKGLDIKSYKEFHDKN